MNVYDFDGTIYHGDSTIDFYLYCLKSDLRLLRFIPKQTYGFIRYGLKKIDKTTLKESFFCFLCGVQNVGEKVDAFWGKYSGRIYPWYLEQAQATDIVISASPYFLLKPLCDELQISDLIASDVDMANGHFHSANCRSTEKVTRFAERHCGEAIDAFYSDSLSDQPMADIAQSAFLVKKGVVQPWDKR